MRGSASVELADSWVLPLCGRVREAQPRYQRDRAIERVVKR
jgi:hypothetical protein